MAYNPTFRLNPEQLEMIEDALRSEIGRLATPLDKDWTAHKSDKGAIRQLNELLAHLHDQKWWHRPKQPVPMG